MTPAALFVLSLILVAMAGLILTNVGPDLILLALVTVFLLVGILTPAQAFAGFSNEGVLTVGVLYVVVTGVQDTGAVGWIMRSLLGHPTSVLGAQARMMFPVAFLSAFLNNTPLVAMLIPAVKDWAKVLRIPASRLMIPLSYAAILGSVCTLIGTSTNLVVAGLVASAIETGVDVPGLRPMRMFDITLIGLPVAIIGILFIMTFGRWLLPNRASASEQMGDTRQYIVEMLVEPGSPLVDRTIEQAGLRHLPGMFLAEIDRNGEVLAAVAPTTRLEANDRLVFVGIVESVVDLQRIRGLKPATDQVFKLDSPRSHRLLIETVVSNNFPYLNRSIRQIGFRKEYNAVVIAVCRNGELVHKKIGDIELQAGDTLLLEAHPTFVEQQRNSNQFFLVSPIENSTPPRHERAILSIGLMLVLVVGVAVGWLTMLTGGLLVGGLMIATGCTSARRARQAVDWQVLLVIGSAFGVSRALEVTGAASWVGNSLIQASAGSPILALIAVYFVTVVFTEMLTNAAAVALVFPIALATAQRLDVNFFPFALAMMIAGSASFATAIGYQTNMMVCGPGGYRSSDYLRIGVPLGIVVGVVALSMLLLLWPLQG